MVKGDYYIRLDLNLFSGRQPVNLVANVYNCGCLVPTALIVFTILIYFHISHVYERFLFTTTATFYILITLRDIVIRQGFVHSPQKYEYKTGFNATVHFFDNNGCT